jgi:16S rRNA processing protein RimM
MKKEECFFLGIISKKHGYKGDVNIKLDVTPSENFKELNHLFIELNGNLVPFFISSLRFKNNGFIVVKFEDEDNDESANALIGKSTYLPLEYLPQEENPLKALVYYTAIDDKHGELGKIIDIQSNNGQDLFVIDYDDKEILIPITEHFISQIDKDKKIVHLITPDGLIDLFL